MTEKIQFKLFSSRLNNFSYFQTEKYQPGTEFFRCIFRLKKFSGVKGLKDWKRKGGILIITYDQFKNHVNLAHEKDLIPQVQDGGTNEFGRNSINVKVKAKKKAVKRIQKKFRADFLKHLIDPGPDIVILDEAHIIKNQMSNIHTAVVLISTQRRLALTGTPMQNNLEEYYWMCHFVKPHLLGTFREYKNQYSITIERGQRKDASASEVQLMRDKAALLYTILAKTVDRKDEEHLAAMLEKKVEYLIQLRLTPIQEALYKNYFKAKGLAEFMGISDQRLQTLDEDMLKVLKQEMKKELFKDKLWLESLSFHPGLFQRKMREEEEADDDSEGSMADFLDDETSEAGSTTSTAWSSTSRASSRVSSRASSSNSRATNSTNSSKKKKKKSKKKKKNSDNQPKDSETLYLLEKDLPQLERFCKKELTQWENSLNTSGEIEHWDFEKVDEKFNEILQAKNLMKTRRLAYQFHHCNYKQNNENGKFEFPIFLSNGFIKKYTCPVVIQQNLKRESTLQITQMLKDHFQKQFRNNMAKVHQEMNKQSIKNHISTEVEKHQKTKIGNWQKSHRASELRRISESYEKKIEDEITDDCQIKSRLEQLQLFENDEIEYMYDDQNIDITLGSKLNFVMQMLAKCERMGEKIVLASQRMDVLDQIEACLRRVTEDTIQRKNQEKIDEINGKKKTGALVIESSDDDESEKEFQGQDLLNVSLTDEYKHVSKW